MTARTSGTILRDVKITGVGEVKAIKADSSKIAGVVVKADSNKIAGVGVVKIGSNKIAGGVVKIGSNKIAGGVVGKADNNKIAGVVGVVSGIVEMIEETLSKEMTNPLHPRILRKYCHR